MDPTTELAALVLSGFLDAHAIYYRFGHSDDSSLRDYPVLCSVTSGRLQYSFVSLRPLARILLVALLQSRLWRRW